MGCFDEKAGYLNVLSRPFRIVETEDPLNQKP